MNPTTPTPPRWAERLLRFLLPDIRSVRAALGDLHAEWEHEARLRSRWRAVAWYLREGADLLRYRLPGAPRDPDERGAGPAALVGDLRLAFRGLAREPLLPTTAVLTLGPALAAAALGLVLVWAALRPLPYPDADRLVSVEHTWDGYGVGGISVALHRHYQAASTLRGLGLADPLQATLVTDEGARRIPSELVTARGLETLGVRPARGRLIREGEDLAGAAPVMMVSWDYWQDQMGGDPDVLGRTLEVDGMVREVVGVLAENTDFPGPEPALVLPAELDPDEPYIINMAWLKGIARLAPGASPETAEAELRAILSRVVVEEPDGHTTAATLEQNGIAPVVRPLKEMEVGPARPFLLMLAGSVVLLLVLAVAAVANLVVGRAERHGGELRLRRVLGATRGRVLAHLLSEAGVVALAAALPGAAGAWLLTRLAMAQSALALPRTDVESLPLLAAATALVGGVVLVPLLAGLPLAHLAATGRGRGTGDGRLGRRGATARSGLRRIFLAVQVAASTVLLVAGLSLGRSALSLASATLGFQPEGLLTFRMVLPETRYADVADAEALHRALSRDIAALPGVRSVGFGVGVPVADRGWGSLWEIEGRPATEGEGPTLSYRHVSADYLPTLGVPVVAGRGFEEADNLDDRPVALVNVAMAERFWGSPSAALGRRIRARSDEEAWTEVVGVVGNTADRGPGREPEPMIYATLQVSPSDPYHLRYPTYVVRTRGPVDGLVPAIRTRLAAMDPSIPLAGVRDYREILRDATARERTALTGIGVAALTSLLVVAAGLGGLVLVGVLERRREIGIRKAVGAGDTRLRWMVLRGVVVPGVAGLVLGAAAVVAGARVPPALLHGTGGSPGILVATASVLALVVVVAGLIGSRRVTGIQPSEALRAD